MGTSTSSNSTASGPRVSSEMVAEFSSDIKAMWLADRAEGADVVVASALGQPRAAQRTMISRWLLTNSRKDDTLDSLLSAVTSLPRRAKGRQGLLNLTISVAYSSGNDGGLGWVDAQVTGGTWAAVISQLRSQNTAFECYRRATRSLEKAPMGPEHVEMLHDAVLHNKKCGREAAMLIVDQALLDRHQHVDPKAVEAAVGCLADVVLEDAPVSPLTAEDAFLSLHGMRRATKTRDGHEVGSRPAAFYSDTAQDDLLKSSYFFEEVLRTWAMPAYSVPHESAVAAQRASLRHLPVSVPLMVVAAHNDGRVFIGLDNPEKHLEAAVEVLSVAGSVAEAAVGPLRDQNVDAACRVARLVARPVLTIAANMVLDNKTVPSEVYSAVDSALASAGLGFRPLLEPLTDLRAARWDAVVRPGVDYPVTKDPLPTCAEVVSHMADTIGHARKCTGTSSFAKAVHWISGAREARFSPSRTCVPDLSRYDFDNVDIEKVVSSVLNSDPSTGIDEAVEDAIAKATASPSEG